MLENEIRLSLRRDARVEKFGDVRMRQPAEDAALAFESLRAAAARERNTEELDRRLALEASVAALREPDAAHSALAKERHQRVRADGLARESRLTQRRNRALFEETLLCQRAVLREERLQMAGQLGILFPRARPARPRAPLPAGPAPDPGKDSPPATDRG